VTDDPDDDAVAALTRLGLSTYEARVFVALVRLGSGTARDVASVADVPRSQVYATVEDLEERGFVSVGRSSPQVFHPVSLAEARSQLERRFERRRDEAFDRLAAVERTAEDEGEQSEEVWSITGETAVTERACQLVAEAERTVVYGASDLDDPDPDLLAALAAACDRGVEVVVVAEHDQSVAGAWADLPRVREVRLAPETGNEYAERVVVVDFDVFLLSIRGVGTGAETAVWSAHTTFARLFSRLIAGSFPGVDPPAGGD
jgi:sugar-specific transcriptional regulator TrmB